MNLVAIFIGGGLGSLCRYGIGKFIMSYDSSVLAYATLFSNVLSIIVLALFVYFFQEKTDLNEVWKLFVITGFCGGFSTFSTFSFETFEMLRNGQNAMAFANVFVSILLCLFILYIIFKKSII
tara:strand:- start:3367 stop:3735 length:369 start_codon:yes stop_codon:yes gene_type:complete